MHRTIRAVVVACVLLFLPAAGFASKGGSHAAGSSHSSHAKGGASSKPAHAKASTHSSTHASAVPRSSNGRIKRSPAAKQAFEKQTGYPHGRPGYVVDHIVPLA